MNNKNQNSTKISAYMMVFVIIVVLISPYFVSFALIMYSNINSDQTAWIGYWGSMICSVITMIGVVVSIYHTTEISRNSSKEILKKEYRPVLIVNNKGPKNIDQLGESGRVISKEKEIVLPSLFNEKEFILKGITNIGQGIAQEVKIVINNFEFNSNLIIKNNETVELKFNTIEYIKAKEKEINKMLNDDLKTEINWLKNNFEIDYFKIVNYLEQECITYEDLDGIDREDILNLLVERGIINDNIPLEKSDIMVEIITSIYNKRKKLINKIIKTSINHEDILLLKYQDIFLEEEHKTALTVIKEEPGSLFKIIKSELIVSSSKKLGHE